jgi:hypothetical protein
MNKFLLILIVLLFFTSLVGCIEEQKEKNAVPFESFDVDTYVDGDTYNYQDVFKLSTLFMSYDEFCKRYSLNKDGDFYIVDNYSKWLEVYCYLEGCVIDPLPYAEGNKPYIDNIKILIRRTASSSNTIKSVYLHNTNNNTLEVEYPFIIDTGDEGDFYCFDFVTISRYVFDRLYPQYNIDTIPFENIEDEE